MSNTYLWISCDEDGEVRVVPFITDDISACMESLLDVSGTELSSRFFDFWPEPDPMYWPKDRNHLLVEVKGIVVP